MAATEALRIGLLGKLPAHGDFVRRGDLPAGFCEPWDAWLQAGVAAARAALGEDRWVAVWDAAPAWRFALPAGACGTAAAAGVLLPSRDAVGRRWPLTLVAVAEAPGTGWPADWFAALEGAARLALATEQAADALAAALPIPAPPPPAGDPLAGFWAALAAGPAADASVPREDPSPSAADPAMMAPEAASVPRDAGWWTAAGPGGEAGLVWSLAGLPDAEEFVLLLEAEP